VESAGSVTSIEIFKWHSSDVMKKQKYDKLIVFFHSCQNGISQSYLIDWKISICSLFLIVLKPTQVA